MSHSFRLIIIVTLVVVFAVAVGMPVSQSVAQDSESGQPDIFELTLYGKYDDAWRVAEKNLRQARQEFRKRKIDREQLINFIIESADLNAAIGRYDTADVRYAEAIDLAGSEGVQTSLRVFNEAASFYQRTGSNDEAEALYVEALNKARKSNQPDDVQNQLNNLGQFYSGTNEHRKAEKYLVESLKLAKKNFEKLHANEEEQAMKSLERRVLSTPLHNLATLYDNMGRFEEAEQHYLRSLKIREEAVSYSGGHISGEILNSAAETRANLTLLYMRQKRYVEAIHIQEKWLYKERTHYREYANLKQHPAIANTLGLLSRQYALAGNSNMAVQHAGESRAIFQGLIGTSNIDMVRAHADLGNAYFSGGQWPAAMSSYDDATKILKAWIRRPRRIGAAPQQIQLSFEDVFWRSISTRWALAQGQSGPTRPHVNAALEYAQLARQSAASRALQKLAIRQSSSDEQLRRLVRQRQDLASQWRALNRTSISGIGQSESSSARRRQGLVDRQITDIDKRLEKEFPEFAALANPEPLSVSEVQSQLQEDEALVLFLDTEERQPTPELTFLWVVTKNDVRWVRSEFGTKKLQREVAALRCGLDPSSWSAKNAKACAEHLGITVSQAPKSGDPLPFDVHRAHKLYAALFGEVEDLIADKQLLIVPSGPLTQFPFHALVTEPPTSNDIGPAAWLAKRHAITVLPAVSSLSALRAHAQVSSARKPFLGFGNPLLDGNLADKNDIRAARQARAINGCAKAREIRTASLRSLRGISQIKLRSSRVADRDDIAIHTPLPETADELCRIARAVGADLNADVHLGAEATESAIKEMNTNGKLRQYKVLSFATHGATAGQFIEVKEPGLILTPPEEDASNDHDDGYLSASEIAGLKLDADWVILSACNTASGDAKNADALSGLARTFFYAGARALLVSHWSVYSSAAVELATGAFEQLKANAQIGRAEALRQSMLRLIAQGGKSAHPSYWAPFVVVGEGGAGR